MAKKKEHQLTPSKDKKLSYPKPPVVVVLGHIDHGKTSLLDAIRKTSFAAKEKGGITQHIGAYQAEHGRKKITFIDTPGHEAFSAMRARGAHIADVAVLVVDAAEGAKPQTLEAIAHAKSANLPIIVAINKMDLPSADPKKVKEQLSKEGLTPEEWGGETVFVETSAKEQKGITALLDMIILVSELLDLKYDPAASFSGVVIESTLTKAGPRATVLVNEGILKLGDEIEALGVFAKVKAMEDAYGRKVTLAHPGDAVSVLGFEKVAGVGVGVLAKGNGKGKSIASDHLQKITPAGKLNLILKSDTQGTLEAIMAGIGKISSEIKIIFSGVGEIGDSDILLAKNTQALVLGFNVPFSKTAEKMAFDFSVGVRVSGTIYEILETVEKMFLGVAELEAKKIKGEAQVIRLFKLHSGDVVCGVKVLAGRLKYRDEVKIVRDSKEVGVGWVRGLKKQEKIVQEVGQGGEAGVLIKPQLKVAEGDMVYVI